MFVFFCYLSEHRWHLTVLNINILEIYFRNDASYTQETNKGSYLGGWKKQNFQRFISFWFLNYADILLIKNKIKIFLNYISYLESEGLIPLCYCRFQVKAAFIFSVIFFLTQRAY